jgi:Tfp pilus assembly protein PilN
MSDQLNLLPPERRRLLLRQVFFTSLQKFLSSLLVGLGIVTACGLVAGGTLLIWSWAVSPANEGELQAAVKQYQARRDEIAGQNEKLKVMQDLHNNRLVWAPKLENLSTVIPPGAILTQVAADSVSGHLVLSGQALARSVLIVLEQRLQVLPWVDQVDAPPSNLLQRESPIFDFDLTLKGVTKPTKSSP